MLTYDEPLSNFALNFNLRPFTKQASEMVKIKDEALKKQQAETAKATEASKMMDKWRLKAEEAGKKISQLEIAVKDAGEAGGPLSTSTRPKLDLLLRGGY